jgi:hypothetical protein
MVCFGSVDIVSVITSLTKPTAPLKAEERLSARSKNFPMRFSEKYALREERNMNFVAVARFLALLLIEPFSFWRRAVIPAGVWSFASFYTLRRRSDGGGVSPFW